MQFRAKLKVAQLLQLLALSIGLVAAAQAAPSSTAAAAKAPRPNIVLIVADDLGWGDIGPFGQNRIRTPNLDRLSSEGLRLSQFYSGAPVCAPSRAVLLTGRHTGRQYVDRNAGAGDMALRPAPEDETFVQALQRTGYKTTLVGKWGLGGATRGPDLPGGTDSLVTTQSHSLPRAKGFDHALTVMDQATAHEYYAPTLWNDETTIPLGSNPGRPLASRTSYMEDAFTSEALRTLAEADDSRPLYLQFMSCLPHRRVVAPPGPHPYANEPWPKVERDFAAMVTRLDTQVGQVMDAIRSNPALRDNTVIWFTSDNGPHATDGHDPHYFTSSGPWRGMKRDLYEGGIRVPTLLWWPGRVEAGTSSSICSGFVDVAATICDIAQTSWTKATDGISLAALTDSTAPPIVARPPLVWLFFEPGAGLGEQPQRAAVRHGDWKLIVKADGTPEVYNVAADPGEKNNVLAARPDVAERLYRIATSQSTQQLPPLKLPAPAPAAARAIPTVNSPNILWIMADDMGPDAACYGTPLARTPNIDRLAAQGVLYQRAYSTVPVCSPSRSALMAGRYSTTFDAQNHRSNASTTLPRSMATITELFRSAGYFTCNDNGTGRPGKQDFNFLLPSDRPAFDGVRWEERAPGQPFFAQVNLGEPHRRFRRNAAAPTDAAAVTLPSYYPPGSLAKQDWALYLDTVHLLDRRVGEVLQRLDAAGLTTSTIVFFFADNGRGHFRDKQFLYDGGVHVPLIVRWPEHLPAGTTQDRLVSLLDVVHDSLRVASITPAPSMDNAGQAFLDLPQESPPRRDAVYASRDRCDETLERMRMVRTASHSYIRNFRTDLPYLQPNRYKFGEYPVWRQMLQLQTDRKLTGPVANFAATVKPVEELYDLKNDPDEVHNLAADPAYAATLGEMRIRMARWLDRDGDDGAIPEPPDTSQKMTEFYNGRYGPVKLWTVEGAETYP